jgi:hypothetical protein
MFLRDESPKIMESSNLPSKYGIKAKFGNTVNYNNLVSTRFGAIFLCHNDFSRNTDGEAKFAPIDFTSF